MRIETKFKALDAPVWTENKARVIQCYLRYFVFITKHGTYLDGFAGPQIGRANDDAWAAKLVLETKPDWLRRFVLCEADEGQLAHLRGMVEDRRSKGDKRPIELLGGDVNAVLPEALARAPVGEREAAFCLLDQRTFECAWSTVEAVARHKTAGNKIEIFYFLPVHWLFRSVAAVRDDAILRRWWGRDDFALLRSCRRTVDVAPLFRDRFLEELGYASVHAWPIRDRHHGGRVMFFMVHASDHPEAARLMYRAYRRGSASLEPEAQVQLEMTAAGFALDG